MRRRSVYFLDKCLFACFIALIEVGRYIISSLKCHEIGLNEHDPIKKHKSIALKSRGKSSKALKALESEEESTSEDSEEDPELFRRWLCSPTNYIIWLRRTEGS